MDSLHALVARQDGDQITTAVETLDAADLPPGEVTIRVAYSSVNFKDALALTRGAAWCATAATPSWPGCRPTRWSGLAL